MFIEKMKAVPEKRFVVRWTENLLQTANLDGPFLLWTQIYAEFDWQGLVK